MQEKIMIVDDEPDIVSMLKDYFEMNGYRTITAANGQEAIEKIERCPDIIRRHGSMSKDTQICFLSHTVSDGKYRGQRQNQRVRNRR